MTPADAKAFPGYLTVAGLQEAWRAKHRTPDCQLVRFQVGDLRDRDRFLNWTGRAGGDYVGNVHRAADDAAALTPEQLAPLTRAANERDRARLKSTSQVKRDEMAALAAELRAELRANPNRDVEKSLRAVEHHLASMDRKLRAA